MSELTLDKKLSKINRIWVVLFWPLVILWCYYLYNLDAIYVEEEFKIWSIVHIILHSFPIFLYFANKKGQGTFPFIEILAAFNIVHYGLPVLFIELEDYQLGILKIEGLMVAFQSYLIFYVTYYIFLGSKWKVKGIEFINAQWSIRKLKVFGYILLGTYFIGIRVPEVYHLGFVGFYVYIGLFLWFWKNRYLSFTEKVIFAAFLLYEFLNRALDGLLSPLAMFALFITLCILMTKINKLLILIMLSLCIWFYSIFSVLKFDFREKVWFSDKAFSISERIALIRELYEESKLKAGTEMINKYKGKEHFLWRFSYQLTALSMVTEMTPETVPYWDGESYEPIFSKFIPRFMWPDKPVENMGYKFGITYNIINRWNTRTSMNTPILAEMYMNFGYFGLYFGCALMGFFYFLLSSWFNSSKVSFTSRVIGMAIIFPLMIWESNFSLTFGNLILVTFVFFIVCKLIDRFVK